MNNIEPDFEITSLKPTKLTECSYCDEKDMCYYIKVFYDGPENIDLERYYICEGCLVNRNSELCPLSDIEKRWYGGEAMVVNK